MRTFRFTPTKLVLVSSRRIGWGVAGFTVVGAVFPATPRRATVVAVLAGAGIALGACGGDDEESTGPATDTGVATETAPPADTGPAEAQPQPTQPDEEPRAPGDQGDARPTPRPSPEDQPGGAGDEIPASSQALLTGRAGRVTPRLVRVPPFIAVRVVLRSADGARYTLSGPGRRVSAGGRISSMSATFDGLRPGKRLVLRGTGGRVLIEASAEPGP